MELNVGDKVKHINTGDHIYIVKKVNNDVVATLEKPKELWTFINLRLTIKDAVCRIENLIKIE
jgi:bifunctional DNA-binding transcriptional regulator/antitoxin component of YhaV-PrlF toxin-antitoxin module